ncbi:uncharacterized protein IL334_005326 [Kwoniella shivajii]|uniref:Uncharacterized protein n=1 Tax=Kwoniella shivajii TaxID=564305 RepID=A0ABZ1D2U4_9TREE|nr:hypothetical protein IL334_005326 [Kwoniella shivajii]
MSSASSPALPIVSSGLIAENETMDDTPTQAITAGENSLISIVFYQTLEYSRIEDRPLPPEILAANGGVEDETYQQSLVLHYISFLISGDLEIVDHCQWLFDECVNLINGTHPLTMENKKLLSAGQYCILSRIASGASTSLGKHHTAFKYIKLSILAWMETEKLMTDDQLEQLTPEKENLCHMYRVARVYKAIAMYCAGTDSNQDCHDEWE